MSYLDKYKGQDGRRSVYDILSLDPNNQAQWENVIKPNYVATDMDKVVIGGNTFTNYGDFQFAWEKSYVKSPERSADGSIGNLNSYATFVTPHLIINFGIMSIDDYRRIMRLDLEANEFVVECYDPIYNNKFKGKMYFGTPQMAKLLKLAKIRFNGDAWEEFVELVGVQEYTVELIGTNADLDLVGVRYEVNAPYGETPTVMPSGEEEVYKGEDIVIGTSTDIPTETFGGKYKFRCWNISPDNPTYVKATGNYTNGYAYTINEPLVLYAQWDSLTNRTLTYNYGVAQEDADKAPTTYPTSKTVVKDRAIGTLPPIPKYPQEDKLWVNNPYHNGGWYKTPIKAEGATPLTGNELYWSDRDGAIYLLYDVYSYDLVLKIERDESNPHPYDHFYIYQANAHQYGNPIKYGSPITLPTPVREGYKFDGWYKGDDFRPETKFSNTTMPAENYTLYGRWVEE